MAHKLLWAIEDAQILMVRATRLPDDTRFVLDLLRGMNANFDKRLKFRVTFKYYNLLLMSLARFALVDEMKGLYDEMLDDEMFPNMCTFNTMVNGYYKLGNLGEANVYLSETVKASFSMYIFTYT